MLLRTAKSSLFLFLLFQAIAINGFPQDSGLLRLVPSESQIVAGVRRPSTSGQLGSLLFVTRNNLVDYDDFCALTGGDASRVLHDVVFIASVSGKGGLSEHGLLAGGHFDRDAVFKLAERDHASEEIYRGVMVLTVPAFARERGPFDEVRWLAILNDKIAIFGSVASVQRVLDRWIANSLPEPGLINRLGLLGGADDTWCLLPAISKDGIVESILAKLDVRLGELAGKGASIQYGIRFGRKVEVIVATGPTADVNEKSGAARTGVESMPVSNFLSNSDNIERDVPKRVVVKVSQQRYEKWLGEFSIAGKKGARSH